MSRQFIPVWIPRFLLLPALPIIYLSSLGTLIPQFQAMAPAFFSAGIGGAVFYGGVIILSLAATFIYYRLYLKNWRQDGYVWGVVILFLIVGFLWELM